MKIWIPGNLRRKARRSIRRLATAWGVVGLCLLVVVLEGFCGVFGVGAVVFVLSQDSLPTKLRQIILQKNLKKLRKQEKILCKAGAFLYFFLSNRLLRKTTSPCWPEDLFGLRAPPNWTKARSVLGAVSALGAPKASSILHCRPTMKTKSWGPQLDGMKAGAFGERPAESLLRLDITGLLLP